MGLGLVLGAFESAVKVAVVGLLLFARLQHLSREDTSRFLNICFIAGRVAQATGYWQMSDIDSRLWWLGLWVMLPAFGFMFLGIRLRRRMNSAGYDTGVRLLLSVMAAGLLARALL